MDHMVGYGASGLLLSDGSHQQTRAKTADGKRFVKLDTIQNDVEAPIVVWSALVLALGMVAHSSK